MADDTKSRHFHRLWLRLVATTGITAAVLLSWWWKVDALRAPTEVPVAVLGQSVDMGRTRLTPLLLEFRKTSDQSDQLVMTATAENITGETQVAIFGMRPPEATLNGAVLTQPEIILLRDQRPLSQLQPRLPEQIELVWPLPDGTPPQEVGISFSRQSFKLKDNLYGQSNWLGYVPAAQMTITPGMVP